MEYAMNRRSFLKVFGIGGVAAGVGVKGVNNFRQARINMKKRFARDDITYVDYEPSDQYEVWGYMPGDKEPRLIAKEFDIPGYSRRSNRVGVSIKQGRA